MSGTSPSRESVESVARAAAALRAGAPVAITEGGKTALVLATETATGESLAGLGANPSLLLTHARATTLKIRLYTADVVALPIAPGTTPDALRTIADPTADLSEPLKGPFDARREPLPKTFAPAIKLAKLAGLLPSVIAVETNANPAGTISLTADSIRHYDDALIDTLQIVTRARVPLDGAEKTELVAFRPGDGGPEHYAIVIGSPSTQSPVLARLHSECFTGDLLGSLKCDCGEQLRGAIKEISEAGSGILLYLAQEGRGIGLINKLRAYRLQDQGFDTIEANERLGFEADERLYGIAAKMLSLLGHKSVRLMTNNPEKVAALESAGIKVAERVPHAFESNEHNRAYLDTKAKKAGHLF
ncbi:MAG TPA: GTP cyclohydrolase II [Rhizomicrobium sp.]|nr:GTP cyclohydrolase II [Rhizomicrobium sp.]